MPTNTLHPAPTLPDDQNQSLLHRTYNLYNGYRVLLTIVFALLVLFPPSTSGLAATVKTESLWFCILYGIIALGNILFFPSLPKLPEIFAITLMDIILLVLLQTTNIQQPNGLTNLIFIPVAIGNILIPGKKGIVLAAMASILLLVNDYLRHTSQELDTGLSGVLFFASALLIQNYNRRLQNTTSRAKLIHRRAVDLQKLSNFIMQHMHTAIIVLREPDDVVMMNSAAINMLASKKNKGSLSSISENLTQAYKRWQANPHCRHNSFRTAPNTPKVQPNFTRLAYESDVYILIFLEDRTAMAQQAQQLKLASLGQLTASIAHEIRNPLSAISHSAELMEESPHLSPSDQKLIGIIEKHCSRINSIVETVLQLSRKEQWLPEQLDLEQWVRNFVRDEHFTGFEHPQITITSTQQQILAFFDFKQLQQVLMNLCLNGLRYSQRNTAGTAGTAALEIRIGREPSPQAWLEVIDRGAGISEENKNNVFNPFFTTDKEGTGLGLYICRELCEANRASLELLSPNAYGGCTFRITFASYP